MLFGLTRTDHLECRSRRHTCRKIWMSTQPVLFHEADDALDQAVGIFACNGAVDFKRKFKLVVASQQIEIPY